MEDSRLPTWISAGRRVESSTGRSHRVPAGAKNARSQNRNAVVAVVTDTDMVLSCAKQKKTIATKRSRDEDDDDDMQENELVRLVREQKWDELLARCQTSSVEAFVASRETPLGVFCTLDMHSSADLHSRHVDITRALLHACPEQVRNCSRGVPGHTPLRAALHNRSCSAAAVELLLEADTTTLVGERNTSIPAVRQVDQDGMLPIEHIVKAIYLGSYETGAWAALDAFVRQVDGFVGGTEQLSPDAGSPLVRLFSLGTSFGVLPASPFTVRGSKTQIGLSRIDRIVRCTRTLLEWDPRLIGRCSTSTGCSPLHAALRNYGNCYALIQELMQFVAEDGGVLTHRNKVGDLPLHVACAVGVPFDVLRLVLTRTLAATGAVVHHGPHPLVWSRNAAGYTPVDLEWIRHIEGGNGFFSHRSFYPLDARGVRKPVGRDVELYGSLLQQAVDEVLSAPYRGSSKERIESVTDANKSFGLLLHRIFLVVRAAFHDSFSSSPVDLSGDILHLASALNAPTGPNLPQPILDLIRWQYSGQMLHPNHLGRLPLHCCFCFQSTITTDYSLAEMDEVKFASEWRKTVNDTLSSEPSACRIPDKRGRLPLHYALECAIHAKAKMSDHTRNTIASIVDDLLDVFPDSIAACDPVTGTYPFMMASLNPQFSLDIVFRLLKLSPGVIARETTTRATTASS